MPNILKNKFVKPSSGINFTRSLFPYEKRHSTNMLAGYIVPVHTQFLYPGTSPDWNFGCVVESAPLISTCLDNIYIDIVSIWCPMRLVMHDWNEFLGESHSTAFTINRNITIPKLATVVVEDANSLGLSASSGVKVSRAYLADHYLAPHLGYRLHTDTTFANDTHIATESKFKNGVSVIPSRIYELNWNTFFRNENIQQPILLDLTSTYGSHDSIYVRALGPLRKANRLKTFYNIATPAPSLLDVSLALGDMMPVGVSATSAASVAALDSQVHISSGNYAKGEFGPILLTGGNGAFPTNGPILADLSSLTVNKMVYALMEQRFANKMVKGRRAIEFYQNFFGIKGSDAGHDMPTLLTHKRFPINVSQVITTANSTDIDGNTQTVGSRGAFSNTGFGGSLVKNFTATEHGYIQTYAIIRGQESIYQGIDHFLGQDQLLDFYLPEFDHIAPVGIERLELNDQGTYSTLYYGYTNAWYAERNQVSDVAGILEPGQPLSYKTLAQAPGPAIGFATQYDFKWLDHLFLFPVAYDFANFGTTADSDGVPYASNRYQFLIQFAVKGKFAAVMSPDSEPLKLRI